MAEQLAGLTLTLAQSRATQSKREPSWLAASEQSKAVGANANVCI